ncbi:hypothetical protein TRIATDRAFT_147759 [Trichoderma atroviride IMI 206040]|uniref:DNA replication factor Cdt1 C-terminal domain-containing protein n=1 Tax=Hypocrea atroviridis (strain ATCC 20476 / IMI 206040) TaxID=452589 RepID=G9P5A3_HYPAI|nr:uncharacterized protein TRIATDRAFT_147759 [Trichoderma atroviride IMI 206040]EHK41289.1 hypothetical protein TRIATDRAFT_147759 [Trichoderma atroviride IMI 206040]
MARTTRRRQAEAPSTTQSISSFTRVSKSQAFPDAATKKTAISNPEPTSSRKRKAAGDDADSNHHPRVTRRTVSFAPSSDEEPVAAAPAKRARRGESNVEAATTVATPAKGKKVAKPTPSRAASAHKPSESTIVAKSKQGGKTVQTKLEAYRVTSQKKAKEAESEFSPELVDLIRLHKAFLKTITLQIIHNGTIVPIDISSVAPHISRTWGKRQVTVDDIRTCIAVQTSARDPDVVSPFIVSDYGRGKICIELHPDHNNGAVSINEERLSRQFEENLRALCAGRAQDDVTDADVPLASLSLKELPRAEIRNMDSSIKINPILNKGHNALSALKEGIVAKQQEKEVKQQATIAMVNSDGTKMSLLDRLRHKQLAKANGPLPPSGPELQRRAALNRVADVCATVSMLSLSNPASLPRQAFTMVLISDKLKDSLRVPLSKEEGMTCIRLIANEIAPEWLKVVTIGGRENVVIQRGLQPVDRVIQERVQKLLA